MPEGSSKTGPANHRVQYPDGPSILVVGAGAAGLAAARALAVQGKHANCRICVLEASNRVGGRLFCEEIDGFQVYSGASVIHESFASTRNLAHELGVQLHKGPDQKGGQIYAGGRFWSMFVGGSLKQSLTTLHTMFFSPQHTLAGSLEFMRMFAMLKKRAKDFDFEDHASLLNMDARESFAEFACRNSFQRYLKQAGELDLNCFTAGSSEQVGAAYGMALLWLWTFDPASRSHLPRQGIGAFAKGLIDSCAGLVRVSTPVERIILDDGRVKGVVTADGERIDADAVICATTASTAARIIPDLRGGGGGGGGGALLRSWSVSVTARAATLLSGWMRTSWPRGPTPGCFLPGLRHS